MTISRWIWRRLIGELHRRGQERRESGAFLLGVRQGPRASVRDFCCYDELDPSALDDGYVTLHSRGLKALWAQCRARQLDVVADVHTHPGPDTRQSTLDRRHPMVPVDGHIALIVPNFAHTTRWRLDGVGVHEYLENGWRSHVTPQDLLRLSWWP
ncbi:Mov34/MPN/PAD-1 family protein [Metallibacterium scheffleri]|uniref:Mov34/MPN/PAD-1 family protein n=1 Tax=Metallibacterium scheffleri TaxID=993689 RepID=UPI00144522E4|nr:Mov34/MPN/PAD-1 family protein [Metallibacterium scheffleri]